MKIDHIAYAVHDLDQAAADYRSKFGFELDVRETIESQQVELLFLKPSSAHPTPKTTHPTMIELLAPLHTDGKPCGPLAKFLDKRGPGIHHVCYEVKDIRAELARLSAQGLSLIDTEPRPGAHGTMIAFLHPKSCGGVLTELCEYP